jgi:hypothetical protein
MRPLDAELCMGIGRFVLVGVPRMRARPIADLINGTTTFLTRVKLKLISLCRTTLEIMSTWFCPRGVKVHGVIKAAY